MTAGLVNAKDGRAATSNRVRLDVGPFSLHVEHVPGLPLVASRAFVRGGARLEPSPGWSHLTGRLLAEGTRTRDFAALAEDAESRGAWQQAFGTGETFGAVVDTVSTDWRWALDHLLEVLLEPAFPEERLDWLRRQVQAELESMKDQPDIRTHLAFLDQLFAPHPYGRPVQGTPESLAELTVEACASWHRRALGWGGCLCVAGDVDVDAVLEHLEPRFRALDAPASEVPVPPAPIDAERRREIDLKGSEQAHLFLGQRTVARTHPDLAALEVLGVVLGSGGLSGRLPLQLREKEGLAYHVDVSTAAGCGLDPGRFSVYIGTSARHLERAEASIRRELERLLTDGVDAGELEEARGYLLGRAPFRYETLRQRVELMAVAAIYGTRDDDPEWWPGRLRAVQLADVERVARTWIDPEKLAVTVGRPLRQPSA
ncbi:MAG: pitrilysin family protein [Acidobacteriota bacterium]